MANKLQKRMTRKHNDPLYSRDKRVVIDVCNAETGELESMELILSEEMKALLELVWAAGVYYVVGLMGYGLPIFKWAIEEVKLLDPPEELSYEIMKVSFILRKSLK